MNIAIGEAIPGGYIANNGSSVFVQPFLFPYLCAVKMFQKGTEIGLLHTLPSRLVCLQHF